MAESIVFLEPGAAFRTDFASWRIDGEGLYVTNSAPGGYSVSINTPINGQVTVGFPVSLEATGHVLVIVDYRETFTPSYMPTGTVQFSSRYGFTDFNYVRDGDTVTYTWSDVGFDYNSIPARFINSSTWVSSSAGTTTDVLGRVEEYVHSYDYPAQTSWYPRDQYNLPPENIQFLDVLEVTAAQLGSLTDRTGVLFSAVNEGQNVRVSKFKTGAASRELLAVIPNAKNPSIYKDAKNGLHLAYEDRTDSATKKVRSLNNGATFA